MAERNLRLRLGVFVALTLAGLTGLVIMFGSTPAIFTTKSRYIIKFTEAPGISVGTPVRKSGVRVGEVNTIDLDDDTGEVRVHVLLDRKYQPRPSEDPTITRGILSGDTSIDFLPKPGTDGGPAPKVDPYPVGSEIIGTPPLNARNILSQASGVIPTAQESVIRIMQSFQRIEQAVPKFEKAADEIGGLARAGREMIPEFRQTNVKVQELIGTTDPAADPANPDAQPGTLKAAIKEMTELLRSVRPAADEIRVLVHDNGPEIGQAVKSIRRVSDSVNDVLSPENRKAVSATLKNVQSASDDLTKTIRLAAILLDSADKTLKDLSARLVQSEQVLNNLGQITKPAAENADQIVKDVAATAKTINLAATELSKTLTGVRAVIDQAGRGEGSLQKVLTDPALFNSLNDAAGSAARVLLRFEKLVKDLEVFADKVARRPELIGVGGVVKPSTGLKEAPYAPLPASTPLPPVPPVPNSTRPQEPIAVPVPSIAPIPPVSRDGITIPVPSFKPPLPTNDRPLDLPPR